MGASQKGCFFLDSCVVFAEILGENKDVMEKFKLDVERRDIICYISDSARDECDRKLKYTQQFFESAFRIFAEGQFKFCREQSGKTQLTPYQEMTSRYSQAYSWNYGKV